MVRQDTGIVRMRSATIAVVLLCAGSSTGCFFTGNLVSRGLRPMQLTQPVGVTTDRTGEPVALFDVKRCPEVPDGLRGVRIPHNWHLQPVQPSIYGSDILEISDPVRASQSYEEYAEHLPRLRSTGDLQPLRELSFAQVAVSSDDAEGQDEGSGTPSHGDVEYGFVRSTDGETASAQLFGYDPARGHWVRLGQAPLDKANPKAYKATLAVLLLPLAVYGDLLFGWVIEMAYARDNPGFTFDVPMTSAHVQKKIMKIVSGLRWHPTEALCRKASDAGPLGRSAVPVLRSIATDTARMPSTRMHAACALSLLCPADAEGWVDSIVAFLGNSDVNVRRTAAHALASCGIPSAVPALTTALTDPDGDVRRNAVQALGNLSPLPEQSVWALNTATSDPSWRVRRAARAALVLAERFGPAEGSLSTFAERGSRFAEGEWSVRAHGVRRQLCTIAISDGRFRMDGQPDVPCRIDIEGNTTVVRATIMRSMKARADFDLTVQGDFLAGTLTLYRIDSDGTHSRLKSTEISGTRLR